MPNEQIRTFLEALLAGKPHHLYVLLWTLATKRSHWFQNVEEAIQRATLSSALDLYVGVGLSSRHYENPRDPKPVEIHTQTDRRYNPSDLATYLDDHAIPESGEQERAAKAWEEKIADKDLAIDPSVTVPPSRSSVG